MNPSAAQPEAFEEEASEFDLRQVLTILLERKWLIAACVVLAAAAGVAYVMLTKPVYRATALIEVPEQGSDAIGIERQDFSSDEALKTVERSLQRLSLIRLVVERAEIRERKAFQESFDEPIESMSLQGMAETVLEWATIRLERGTRLIAVSVEHTDRELAKDLSNAIVDAFLGERADKSTGNSVSALESLVSEADRRGKRLGESKSVLGKLEDLIALREKIESQEDELVTLTQSKGDSFPAVVQLRSLIADLNAQFKTKLEQLKPLLPQAETATGGNGNPAGTEPAGQAAVEAEFERLKAHQESLAGEVTTSQALLEAILAQIGRIDITPGLKEIPIEIVEDAYLPTKPIKPKKVQVMAASVVLGGAVGLFLAWGLYAMNRSLRTVDEAERTIGVPVLGAMPTDSRIPDTAWLDKKSKRQVASLIKQFAEESASGKRGAVKKRTKGTIEPLVMLSDPGSPLSESFRTLRASLTLMNRDREKKKRTLLVTSSVPGEGKSFVAANLAIAFASQEGQRTLLIDADLRRPMVDRLFGLKPDGGGLTEALISGNVQVIESGIGNLHILPAGRGAHRPAELLSGNRMDRLVAGLLENYDQIIFDSAPVNTVADALLLAPYVDATLLVSRASKTPRAAIQHARDQLIGAGVAPAGLVLNRLPENSGLSSNPYFYYYDGESRKYGDNYG